ncbi:hypothetical protein ACPFTX_002336 [Vibrio cholerae]
MEQELKTEKQNTVPLSFTLTICAALTGGGIILKNWHANNNMSTEQTLPETTSTCFLSTVKSLDSANA